MTTKTLETPSDFEAPIEFLRHVVSCANMNDEGVNYTLPSVEAIFELYHLTTVVYGIDCWDELCQYIDDEACFNAQIEYSNGAIDGGKFQPIDPKPYNDFVDKYDLPWRKPDIRSARRLGLLRWREREANRGAEVHPGVYAKAEGEDDQ